MLFQQSIVNVLPQPPVCKGSVAIQKTSGEAGHQKERGFGGVGVAVVEVVHLHGVKQQEVRRPSAGSEEYGG